MVFFFPMLSWIMSYVQLPGIQFHHRTSVLTSFIVLPSCRYLKNVRRETLQLLVLWAKQLFSHYKVKSFHPILNLFFYRINYHLLTINAIILSLLQHDLFYKIRSWVILSREISFLFLLGQWLFKHLVSAFVTATLSLTYNMLLSSSSRR